MEFIYITVPLLVLSERRNNSLLDGKGHQRGPYFINTAWSSSSIYLEKKKMEEH